MRLLINIDVPDLAAATGFYAAAFGLTPVRQLGDGVVELLGAEVPIYLLTKDAGSKAAADSGREYARHWMPMHCNVVVDDLDIALARALAAGAVQEGVIREAAWGRGGVSCRWRTRSDMDGACCNSWVAATTRSRRECV